MKLDKALLERIQKDDKSLTELHFKGSNFSSGVLGDLFGITLKDLAGAIKNNAHVVVITIENDKKFSYEEEGIIHVIQSHVRRVNALLEKFMFIYPALPADKDGWVTLRLPEPGPLSDGWNISMLRDLDKQEQFEQPPQEENAQEKIERLKQEQEQRQRKSEEAKQKLADRQREEQEKQQRKKLSVVDQLLAMQAKMEKMEETLQQQGKLGRDTLAVVRNHVLTTDGMRADVAAVVIAVAPRESNRYHHFAAAGIAGSASDAPRVLQEQRSVAP